MPANARRKGKTGELDCAKFLRLLGYESARRGQQKSGGVDSPDVIVDELSNVHLEVKRNESLDLHKLNPVFQQAIRDSDGVKPWAVMWRRNREPWKLTFLNRDGQMVTEWEPGSIRAGLEYLNGWRLGE